MNEIVTKTGLVECDFEAIKAYLESQLSIYKGIVFTEDSKSAAKKTVAELRKQKKEFADRIKMAKAEYMKPYLEFEERAKEIAGLYDEPIKFIVGQIDAFDESRIKAKRAEVYEAYMWLCDDIADFVPLESIYRPAWDNASTSMKSIKDDLMSIKTDVLKGLETIRSMESDIEEEVVHDYLSDFDLGKAVMRIQTDQKRKAQILEEAKKKIEAEYVSELDRAREEIIQDLIPDDDGETETEYEFRIMLTPTALETLKTYLDSIGIDYDFNIAF